jgi:hypothetical protein
MVARAATTTLHLRGKWWCHEVIGGASTECDAVHAREYLVTA